VDKKKINNKDNKEFSFCTINFKFIKIIEMASKLYKLNIL